MLNKCDSCRKERYNTVTAVINGIYYRSVCRACLGSVEVSSNAASHERRRQYEDYAQDTLQPYDAKGPNLEFARMYPKQAEKIYPKEVLDNLKRKM